MRVMTGLAVPVPDRLVFCYRFLLTPDRIGMAFTAKNDHRLFQKPFFLGGMGVMATQTTLLGEQGRMYPALAERLVEHIVVASPAKFIPFSLGLQGGSRRGFTMTLIAHPACHRPVHIVIENPLHVRAVRIMATGAA